jgi:hypothetical protein
LRDSTSAQVLAEEFAPYLNGLRPRSGRIGFLRAQQELARRYTTLIRVGAGTEAATVGERLGKITAAAVP